MKSEGKGSRLKEGVLAAVLKHDSLNLRHRKDGTRDETGDKRGRGKGIGWERGQDMTRDGAREREHGTEDKGWDRGQGA